MIFVRRKMLEYVLGRLRKKGPDTLFFQIRACYFKEAHNDG